MSVLFDNVLFEVLLNGWINRLESGSFSSFGFISDRDAIRRECLSLLPNDPEVPVVPLRRFPIETFCLGCVGLMRERVHENMRLNAGVTSRKAGMGGVRRALVVPASRQAQMECLKQTVLAVVAYRAGQQMTELQVVLGFHRDPISGRFFSRPLLSAADVADCVAHALWRVRCMTPDRSLFFLVLCSLANLLRVLVVELADEASRLIGVAQLEAR